MSIERTEKMDSRIGLFKRNRYGWVLPGGGRKETGEAMASPGKGNYAKREVERYRSPVSGSRTTMVLP